MTTTKLEEYIKAARFSVYFNRECMGSQDALTAVVALLDYLDSLNLDSSENKYIVRRWSDVVYGPDDKDEAMKRAAWLNALHQTDEYRVQEVS